MNILFENLTSHHLYIQLNKLNFYQKYTGKLLAIIFYEDYVIFNRP